MHVGASHDDLTHSERAALAKQRLRPAAFSYVYGHWAQSINLALAHRVHASEHLQQLALGGFHLPFWSLFQPVKLVLVDLYCHKIASS